MEWNIVKKISGNRSGPEQDTSASSSSSSAGGDGQDRSLTLMHMRKLFSEFAKVQVNTPDYEKKLLRILPLFTKVKDTFHSTVIHASCFMLLDLNSNDFPLK